MGIWAQRLKEAWSRLLATSVAKSRFHGGLTATSQIGAAEKREHYRLYYERDRKLMASSTPQLASLCAKYARPCHTRVHTACITIHVSPLIFLPSPITIGTRSISC